MRLPVDNAGRLLAGGAVVNVLTGSVGAATVENNRWKTFTRTHTHTLTWTGAYVNEDWLHTLLPYAPSLNLKETHYHHKQGWHFKVIYEPRRFTCTGAGALCIGFNDITLTPDYRMLMLYKCVALRYYYLIVMHHDLWRGISGAVFSRGRPPNPDSRLNISLK